MDDMTPVACVWFSQDKSDHIINTPLAPTLTGLSVINQSISKQQSTIYSQFKSIL